MAEYADGTSIADVIAEQDSWFYENGGTIDLPPEIYGGSEYYSSLSSESWDAFSTGFGDGKNYSLDVQDALWDAVIGEVLPNIKTAGGAVAPAGTPTGNKPAATENGKPKAAGMSVGTVLIIGVAVLVVVVLVGKGKGRG
ncbi:MAG: hypothetical protein KGZ83_17465 [Sulfuricella sp.]|nr:hypothetical protein [Sulfuricella sp.]